MGKEHHCKIYGGKTKSNNPLAIGSGVHRYLNSKTLNSSGRQSYVGYSFSVKGNVS